MIAPREWQLGSFEHYRSAGNWLWPFCCDWSGLAYKVYLLKESFQFVPIRRKVDCGLCIAREYSPRLTKAAVAHLRCRAGASAANCKYNRSREASLASSQADRCARVARVRQQRATRSNRGQGSNRISA
jgi:hypothetical protein